MRGLRVRIILILILIPLILTACQNGGGSATMVLHPREKELTLGMPFSAATQLSVEIRPADTRVELEWISSNESVAIVDKNGFVTALSYGTAHVTVRDTLSGAKSSCKLKIRTVPQELNIRTNNAELRVGRTLNLSPKLTPAPYIPNIYRVLTWSSSATNVATVDARGRVTAVGPGKAEITGETVNGLREACYVVVKE